MICIVSIDIINNLLLIWLLQKLLISVLCFLLILLIDLELKPWGCILAANFVQGRGKLTCWGPCEKGSCALVQRAINMNSGKGGARHTPKPQVDTSLLVQCFLIHKVLLSKLGIYENMSKNQACSPKGIVQVLPLLKGLVDLEPTCEIHGSCLRAAIMEVLTQDPGINATAFKGAVWVGCRVDRITTIMYHLRRLKGSVDLKHCAASLTSLEFLDLQNVLEKVVKKDVGEKHLPLAEREDAKPLAEREDAKPSEPKRTLKREVSNVSIDSQGFPVSLKSPKESKASPEDPLLKGKSSSASHEAKELPQPSFKRRRLGQRISEQTPRASNTLRDELGIGACKKKPAGRKNTPKSKSKPSSTSLVKGSAPACYPRKEWVKLKVTKSKQEPLRSYICGTTEPGGKVHLIVETRQARNPKYLEILEEIKLKLETEHITKQEAVCLRDELYEAW